jgi:hypothetical protein
VNSLGTLKIVSGMWWSRRAVLLHLTLAILLPAFTGLFLWQVNRALSGNELSWAYVFEWPFFAGYAVFMWWRLVHEPPEANEPVEADQAVEANEPVEPDQLVEADQTVEATVPEGAARNGIGHTEPDRSSSWRLRRQAAREERAKREEEELAAYNRYLGELHAFDEQRRR